MHGDDRQQYELFSYGGLDERISPEHPLRRIRTLADAALARLGSSFDAIYGDLGRPSSVPEKFLRAMLLQVLYSVRSERALMDQMDLHLGFRWFVGLSLSDPVWDASTFSKNRERHPVCDREQGLIAGACVTSATTKAEREAAVALIENLEVRRRRIQVAADKAYDEAVFVERLRGLGATPQVTQYQGQRRSSIDQRTTRRPSYDAAQRSRKRIEPIFSWLKQVGGQRRTRFRGRDRVSWAFTFAAATYNLMRMAKLSLTIAAN